MRFKEVNIGTVYVSPKTYFNQRKYLRYYAVTRGHVKAHGRRVRYHDNIAILTKKFISLMHVAKSVKIPTEANEHEILYYYTNVTSVLSELDNPPHNGMSHICLNLEGKRNALFTRLPVFHSLKVITYYIL